MALTVSVMRLCTTLRRHIWQGAYVLQNVKNVTRSNARTSHSRESDRMSIFVYITAVNWDYWICQVIVKSMKCLQWKRPKYILLDIHPTRPVSSCYRFLFVIAKRPVFCLCHHSRIQCLMKFSSIILGPPSILQWPSCVPWPCHWKTLLWRTLPLHHPRLCMSVYAWQLMLIFHHRFFWSWTR